MADLSVKQGVAWRYLTDGTKTEVLYGGAAGGGKSRLGCIWEMAMAIEYQGSRWLMGRAILKTLKETTLKSFFDQCTEDGFKVGRDFTYNAMSQTLQFGASEIMLKDLFSYPSDPNYDELGSLELTGAFIDEVNQVQSRAWAIVNSRIRYKLEEFRLTPKCLGTCNPAKNWVFSRFYDPWRKGALPEHMAFVPALVTDNPHFAPIVLPDGSLRIHPYVQKLMDLEGADRARLLDGNWDYDNDPAALMSFDAISNLFTNDHVPHGEKAITADVARYGSDKTVLMLWSGMRVEHIYVYQGQATNVTAAAILATAQAEGVPRSRIVVDDDGVGGGVVDLLPGCVAFNNGGKPIDMGGEKQNYANLKGQCSYTLAMKVNEAGIYIADTDHRDTIAQELSWVKRDKMDHDGKLRILPKDKVKEGLGRSPDFADNLMMRMVLELVPDYRTFERSIEIQSERYRAEQYERNVDDIAERFGIDPNR